MKRSESIEQDIQEHLTEIEQKHDVTVIAAIESGSRALGFRFTTIVG